MSETETREPTWYRRDAYNEVVAERDAARAKAARLRAVVEALRSALERTERNFVLAVHSKPVRDMAENLAENAAALAVSSSGETESSVEAVLRVAADAFSEIEHPDPATRLMQRGLDQMQGDLAAPVSSGGQTDGEGEVDEMLLRGLRRAERLLRDQERHWLADSVAMAVEMLPRLAARPVLSREALRERLDGHWPEFAGDVGDGSLRIECQCGWTYRYVPNGRGRVATWRDHLADVLAGGDQRG